MVARVSADHATRRSSSPPGPEEGSVGLKRPRGAESVEDSDEEWDPSVPVGKLTAQIREFAALTAQVRASGADAKQTRVIPSALRNAFPSKRAPRIGPEFQAAIPEFPGSAARAQPDVKEEEATARTAPVQALAAEPEETATVVLPVEEADVPRSLRTCNRKKGRPHRALYPDEDEDAEI